MTNDLTTTAAIDRLEADMVASCKKGNFPSEHLFVPGVYCRITVLPKGSKLTSMEHITEHFFTIPVGEVNVMSENEGTTNYKGPCVGITKPGTRRVIEAVEETTWITFHRTDQTDILKIADEILAPHENPLIPDEAKNQWKEAMPCLGSQ